MSERRTKTSVIQSTKEMLELLQFSEQMKVRFAAGYAAGKSHLPI